MLSFQINYVADNAISYIIANSVDLLKSLHLRINLR